MSRATADGQPRKSKPTISGDRARLAKLKAAKEDAETRKQWAFDHQAEIYAERDLLVAVLARQWPSHIMRHEHSPASHRAVVCIHSPFGQLTWSVPNDTLESLYRGFCEWGENDYRRDPCKTAEKRARLETYAETTACVFPPDATPLSK